MPRLMPCVSLALALVLASCGVKVPVPDLKAPTDPATLARGAYLAEHLAVCVLCHTPRDFHAFSGLPLPGEAGHGAAVGMLFGYDPPRVVLWAPNITPAALADWSDGELVRAITSGFDRQGRPLLLAMPYDQYNGLSTDDALAIVAYLRTLAPLPGGVPPRKLPFPVDPIVVGLMPMAPHPAARTPRPADGVDYGKYLTTVAGCLWCHTPTGAFDAPQRGRPFAGGHEFPLPTPAEAPGALVRGPGVLRTPNISFDEATGIGAWPKEAFVVRFKAATPEALALNRPGPGQLNSVMPWAAYSGLTEEDLGAIYDYLRTFPAQRNAVERFDPNGRKR